MLTQTNPTNDAIEVTHIRKKDGCLSALTDNPTIIEIIHATHNGSIVSVNQYRTDIFAILLAKRIVPAVLTTTIAAMAIATAYGLFVR